MVRQALWGFWMKVQPPDGHIYYPLKVTGMTRKARYSWGNFVYWWNSEAAYASRPSLARHAGTSKVKLVSMVHNCLHHKAPRYLMDYCIPVSDVAISRWHLRSARYHHLVVPRQSFSSYGRRAFDVAGPTAWNSLSDDLRDPMISNEFQTSA